MSHLMTRYLPTGERVVTAPDTDLPVLPFTLTPEETARLLKMSVASVRKAMRLGELPSVKIGGRQHVVTARMFERFSRQATA
jgi:hypothetical protein